jgi:hypothetical protein
MSVGCFGHKANDGAIMEKGRDKIKRSDAVSCPGCALQGGVMNDDELAWGMDGLCGEVVGEPRRPCQAEREGLGCHLRRWLRVSSAKGSSLDQRSGGKVM